MLRKNKDGYISFHLNFFMYLDNLYFIKITKLNNYLKKLWFYC